LSPIFIDPLIFVMLSISGIEGFRPFFRHIPLSKRKKPR